MSLHDALSKMDDLDALSIEVALLSGLILDAEDIANGMNDRTRADAILADFRVRYAGQPHGQWDGGGGRSEG